MRRPLEGVKVIELSTMVAAPATGRLMADLGAEVIKIERPDGDGWRSSGISFNVARFSQDANPVFDIYNAGKKFIALNMKEEEGQKIFHELLKTADVFLTNNREKALKRLQCSYDDLKEKYPKLIYAQISGFGAKGPDADMTALDTTAFWSRSGFMRDLGVIGEDGSYNPCFPPAGVGDTDTAYLLLSQINAALFQRERTGEGQYVEASLYHTGIFTTGTMQIVHQKPWGRKFPTTRPNHSNPGGYFKCKDGEYIFIATINGLRTTEQMCQLVNRPEMLDQLLLGDPVLRWQQREDLYKLFSDIFITEDSDTWIKKGKELDMTIDLYHHFGDVFEDEQAIANDFVEQVEFRNGVTYGMPRSPFHMGSLPLPQTIPAGPVGADTKEILQALGHNDDEITALLEKGVIKD